MSRGRRVLFMVAVAAFLFTLSGYMRTRLIEQLDNGPVNGPPGKSEGYWWVGDKEWPTAGKRWKPANRGSLTAEQEKRIRNWQWLR
jgi:hypothetical protein